MPEGVIVGGWEYVVAAYALTVAGLGLFIVSLVMRRRSVRRKTADRGTRND